MQDKDTEAEDGDLRLPYRYGSTILGRRVPSSVSLPISWTPYAFCPQVAVPCTIF
jgi:hypothetical protein